MTGSRPNQSWIDQLKQFGSLIIEDYTGKSEFMLWSEDYARHVYYQP